MSKKYGIKSEFDPIVLMHPGEILKEEIAERGMTQKELAKQAKLSAKVISEIINERKGITAIIAVKLQNVLEISAEFWLNAQEGYEINKARKAAEKRKKELRLIHKKKAK